MALRKKPLAAAALLLVVGALMVPVDGGPIDAGAVPSAPPSPPGLDLAAFSDAPPARKVPLLFIHHSCGGQLLAPEGPEHERARCIYETHPNGGGLRGRLEKQGYEVHEASYGSEIGEATDLFDWLPKFQAKMERLLRIDQNDTDLAGKPSEKERLLERGRLARELTSWTRSSEGWLKGYPLKNVVVFDYYDVLTGEGAANLSRYPAGEGRDGRDSHPAAEGNRRAADAFVPFLNRALRRHGLPGV